MNWHVLFGFDYLKFKIFLNIIYVCAIKVIQNTKILTSTFIMITYCASTLHEIKKKNMFYLFLNYYTNLQFSRLFFMTIEPKITKCNSCF